jgi:hypothetical protein
MIDGFAICVQTDYLGIRSVKATILRGKRLTGKLEELRRGEMDGQTLGPESGSRPGVRPSSQDRCAECRDAVGDEWVSYRPGADDPSTLVRHFGGVVKAGPVELRPDRPKRTVRDLRCPDDFGVFFHPWCAPRVELPAKLQEEIAKILAEALVADYQNRLKRWAKVQQVVNTGFEIPRWRVHVGSAEGRRAFTMTRLDWERLRAHEGKLVEIDVERVPAGGVEAAASAIACLAAEYPVHTERIEVWRYNPKDTPTPESVEDYLVLENLVRRVTVPMFAERVSIQDSPKLRKHLQEHVFIVKQQPDKGRVEPKARVLERLVFLRRGTPEPGLRPAGRRSAGVRGADFGKRGRPRAGRGGPAS